LLMLQTHYRSSLDFSDTRLDETLSAYERLDTLVRNLRWTHGISAVGSGAEKTAIEELRLAIRDTREKFHADMDDDFNTAGALAAIFELARITNGFLAEYQSELSETDLYVLGEVEDTVVSLMGVLGVELAHEQHAVYPSEVLVLARDLADSACTGVEEAVDALLIARAAARMNKDWKRADAVRDGLARLGLLIEDTAQGARVVYRPEGKVC
jgi:cysteinyl-tRNA synthetase